MENLLAVTAFFGLCMAVMSIGVLLSGKKLKGSCGGISTGPGGKLEIADTCGLCVKKESYVCPGSEENGELVKLATLGFSRETRHR